MKWSCGWWLSYDFYSEGHDIIESLHAQGNGDWWLADIPWGHSFTILIALNQMDQPVYLEKLN